MELALEELWLWLGCFGAQQEPPPLVVPLDLPLIPLVEIGGAQHDPPLVTPFLPLLLNSVGVANGLSTTFSSAIPTSLVKSFVLLENPGCV